MAFVLTVYFKEAIKEIYLPGINNRKIKEVLEKEVSGFENDLILNLDVYENEWFIRNSEDLILSKGEKDENNKVKENEKENENEENETGIKLKSGLKLNATTTENHESIVITVGLYYAGMTEFKKYRFTQDDIFIGSGTSNNIIYEDSAKFVGERHARISKTQSAEAFLEDLDTRNGTFLNGRRIKGKAVLNYGDIIFIMGLKIVYLKDVLAINNPKSEKGEKVSAMREIILENNNNTEPEIAPNDEFYQRSPRKILSTNTEVIEIEAPAAPGSKNRQPLWMTIGPSLTMIIPIAAGTLLTMYGANSGTGASGGNSIAIMMGVITTVTAALIGAFWAIASYKYQAKFEEKEEKDREEKYKAYLEEIEDDIKSKHRENRSILNEMYPEIYECIRWVENKTPRLWEKNVNHPDFLEIRVGVGSRTSPNIIETPKNKFSVAEDKLSGEPFRLKRDYSNITGSSATINLLNCKMLGMIGSRIDICAIARVMAIQAAISHSYTDVRLVFIYNQRERWDFAKWLPHTWEKGSILRMTANDAISVSDVFANLLTVIKNRITEESEKSSSKNNNNKIMPHYLVFIADPNLVENEPIMKYLTNPDLNIGFTTVFLYDRIDKLPSRCTFILQKDKDYSGYYSLNNAFAPSREVKFDMLSDNQALETAKILSRFNLKEAESSGEIPQMLSFLDMYKTSKPETINIYRNWLENHTYESMKALIGYKGGGAELYLDIHEKKHGPHGLVAGTTGAGKSETLQTYILSLALTYHPHEVSFILIDYKGGGMAEGFRNMPHVAGIITNLGGNQTNRALASLNSEILRRQAVFNQYKNIKHIDQYINLYSNAKPGDDVLKSGPIPHLIIIADEFAELKTEQPDFIPALVKAARVGRSLGIHLILATQKPDGLIDPQIESNTRFRLCLRVAERADSMAMIKRPEAASITTIGRGYFQVGNDELFEEFQSGWSGAPYEPEIEFSNDKTNDTKIINLWGQSEIKGAKKKEKNKEIQLDKLVEYMKNLAEKNNIKKIESIWLPPLPKKIFIEDLAVYESSKNTNEDFEENIENSESKNLIELNNKGYILNPIVGLIDDPVKQEQRIFRVNFSQTGHIMLCGTGSGGKTTFLQTLIYSVIINKTPEEINIYIADYGSRILGAFKNAPHIGGVAFDDDPDKTNKLIAMLTKELISRKIKFSDKGVGTFKDYANLFNNNLKNDCPAILFVIDNYSSFMDNNEHLEEDMLLLVKEAASYGIYIIMSCSTSGDLRGRIRQYINYGIGLQLADKGDYYDIMGVRPNITAEEQTPGRGMAIDISFDEEGKPVQSKEPLEFQTALCFKSENIAEELRKTNEELCNKFGKIKAKTIPHVPEDMSYENFEEESGANEIRNSEIIPMIPIGYDLNKAQAIGIDFNETFSFIIGGEKRSGKLNFMKVIINECVLSMKSENKNKDYELVIIDYNENLKKEADKNNIRYINNRESLLEYITELSKECDKRSLLIKEHGGKKANKEVWNRIFKEEKNIIIFISNLGEFIKDIYESEELAQCVEFVSAFTKFGDMIKISVVAKCSKEDYNLYNSNDAFSALKEWKNGIYFGGMVSNQQLFEIDVPYPENTKKLSAGSGYIINDSGYSRIVTPLI